MERAGNVPALHMADIGAKWRKTGEQDAENDSDFWSNDGLDLASLGKQR